MLRIGEYPMLKNFELQLIDNPHDLNIWGDYLDYCCRHNLPQTAYIEYLRYTRNLPVIENSNCWNLNGFNLDDLQLLRGIYSPTLDRIILNASNLKSTAGLESLKAPGLVDLLIRDANNLVLTYLPNYLSLNYSTIIIDHTVGILNLEVIDMFRSKIADPPILYRARNLKTLSILESDPTLLEISFFSNLKKVRCDNISDLIKLGDSISVTEILCHHDTRYPGNECTRLQSLVSNGWYPNLEYPIKGKNKR